MSESRFYPYLVFAICFLGVALGAMNSVLAPSYLPDIIKELNHISLTSENAGAWINFSFLAGGTIGGICLGFISDWIGRKKTLAFALLFCGAGSGIGALCTSWPVLAATRFLVGIGVGAVLVLSVVILTEIWEKKTNGVALGIMSVAYPVGIIASGLITANISDWKMAFMIGLLPIALIIPSIIFIKETLMPRNTKETINHISLGAYKNSLVSGILIYGTMLIGLWSAFAWLPTWVDSLFGNIPTEAQTQRGMAVTLLGLGGLIGGILSGWIAKRFATRQIQGVCFILCFILSFILFKMTKSYSDLVLIGSGLLGFTFGVSQGVLNILIPGLFPVQLRSSATGLCFHVGRAFTAIAVFFTGALAIWLGGYGNAIFIFSGVYVIGLIALLVMKKETYATH
ncbi:MAG: MFS transporter [Saprospiraceae bacterium]|uniref:MFS transporter n=1 Tax=Candidatus Opimibacter skivensis TaxID=2982028 RepID=A0A9D7SV18_9BACT|nr:MFS transporter [Candidatus Opimibacter skivensis]